MSESQSTATSPVEVFPDYGTTSAPNPPVDAVAASIEREVTKDRLIGVRHSLVRSIFQAALPHIDRPVAFFELFKQTMLEQKVPQKNREETTQYLADLIRAKGHAVSLGEGETDPIEQQLKEVFQEAMKDPDFLVVVKPETKPDPIEQQLGAGLKFEPAPRVTPEVVVLGAETFGSYDQEQEKIKKRKDFVFHMCSTAEDLKANLVESWEKGDGMSTLMRPPMVIERDGHRAILVQSFTIPLKGMTVRFDWKANCRPVVVRHPNMFIQADSQKLIRSKVFEAKKREFYVKGLEYQNGMIFKGYIEAGHRDREDLAVFYQVQGVTVVRISEARYREVENLIAADKDPALSLKDPT